MKKVVLTVITLLSIGFAGIKVGRYTDEFGDATGDQFIKVFGEVYRSYNDIGAIMIEIDGSVSYRTSEFIGSSNRNYNVQFRDNTGKNLILRASDIGTAGSDISTWSFNDDNSQKIINMFKSAIWVKVVVRDYCGDAVLTQISANGFTATLKNTFGL